MYWLVSLMLAAGAAAEPDLSAIKQQQEQTSNLQALLRDARRLGPWERNRQVLNDAVASMWRRNGWTSEADEFARQVVGEVSKYPPWQLSERFDTFCEALGDRYDLDASQRQKLRTVVTRDVWAMFFRHPRAVLQVGKELIETRVSGQPFRQDQVARWSKLMQPVVGEIGRTVDGWAAEIGDELSPEQQALLKRDVAAYQRRLTHSGRLMRKWAKGQWQPNEWGLEKDPLHAGAVAEVKSAAVKRSMPAPATATVVATDSWERHVRNFISRYGLDESQQVTAWSILAEIRERAAARETGTQGKVDRAFSEMLFTELKNRLEMIPTASQRRPAGAGADSSK